MTLAAVSLPYYRLILPYGVKKFARFATEVWNVSPKGKTETALAEKGLAALEKWMRTLGLAMSITELGATPDMVEGIADATFILDGGYQVLTRDEVVKVLKESL